MQHCYYVRNLPKVQNQIGKSNAEFAATLGVSFSTFRRIKKGKPVSIRTASRIQRRINGQKWKKIIVFEQPMYNLRLSLNPNAVRYTRIHNIFPITLISPDTLSQAIKGYAFTKTFARKLRAFFKWVPVPKDEYAIDEIGSAKRNFIVEEWRAKVNSLTSGDELIDLTIILRRQFRGYFDHEGILEKKQMAMRKLGIAEINELRIPTASIKALPVAEKNLLVAFALAHNELAFLARLGTIGGHQARKGRIFDAFSLSQQLTILKLYAGKIHECWNLVRMRYFSTQLSKKYDFRISTYDRENFRFLKKYFNKSRNIISLVRHEAAFHYSRADVYRALDFISGEQGCITYLAGGNYHYEMYEFGEMAMAAHLFDQIDENRKRAVVTFQRELAEVGTRLSHLLKDILFIALQDAVSVDPKGATIIVSKLGLDRKRNTTPIPVLIKPNDYYNEFTKLRRLLKN